MKLYLAGPMSGLPEYNFPAFHAEAARLRALGHAVENPADNPPQADWAGYMRIAITQMLTCDAVALLPGWDRSTGAALESTIAETLAMPVYRPGVLRAAA